MVIGPIDLAHWRTLLMLKEAVKHMQDTNAEKYRLQIKGDTEVFHNILGDFVKAA